ncbi:SURF4 family-domain-containing protein [Cokeromyces recurvatus]|uniref:SURF4 family-domain-containing protein n=1 Tax=Cokeromyces recurvatus TaxID=90255 RepID=UPI00221E4272|nr:SURF4 family-domain-containing protein [Cokeromyces recurvatus]KAI7900372.1 SURF4 family-domain-containing protein [Cokeromyces recurvatus]
MSFEQTIKQVSSQIEDVLDILGQPIKPYLPALSRFLVVVTFYEDAIRMIVQWTDQRQYLEYHRNFPPVISHLFLLFNIISMSTFSSTLIAKRHINLSVSVLISVIVFQALGYGLMFDMVFFLRNLSIIGGLLLCLSESLLRSKKQSNQKSLFASLPTMASDTGRHPYFQLAGRILLVLLFLGFVFQGEWNLLRALVSLIGFAACVMVAVGFRAKWSASLLVTFLCIMNVFVNNWWAIYQSDYNRDVVKYNFFQCLSIMGGLLLLISIGPGHLSYDEKKKEY